MSVAAGHQRNAGLTAAVGDVGAERAQSRDERRDTRRGRRDPGARTEHQLRVAGYRHSE